MLRLLLCQWWENRETTNHVTGLAFGNLQIIQTIKSHDLWLLISSSSSRFSGHWFNSNRFSPLDVHRILFPVGFLGFRRFPQFASHVNLWVGLAWVSMFLVPGFLVFVGCPGWETAGTKLHDYWWPKNLVRRALMQEVPSNDYYSTARIDSVVPTLLRAFSLYHPLVSSHQFQESPWRSQA